jgi:hypothetical protein
MTRAMKFLLLVLTVELIACSKRTLPASVAEVFKHDGSVQCDGGEATSVDEMADELTSAGIEVFCSRKDQFVGGTCAACSCPSGQINVYTIDSQDVPDAESLGFTFADPAIYDNKPCE